MNVTFEWKGLPEIEANLKKYSILAKDGASRGVYNALNKLKISADENLNVQTIPGRSESRPEQSISNNWAIDGPNINPGFVDGTLYNTSQHSHLVEFGTGRRSDLFKGGDITPVHSEYLRFIGGEGIPIYRKWVQGQFPKSYLRNAMQQTQQAILNIIAEGIKSTTGVL